MVTTALASSAPIASSSGVKLVRPWSIGLASLERGDGVRQTSTTTLWAIEKSQLRTLLVPVARAGWKRLRAAKARAKTVAAASSATSGDWSRRRQ